ncbi:hypothetical protein [Embleya sp. NPDC005575]|uniref:hypothetical protein n=1 Tax=Embleya sp. NPDC005575 TaxID=3156892 RepID=UPI0033BC9D9C
MIDDVQRIAAPEPDYLRLLAGAPTTRTCRVLCGAGAERTLARAPASASRVLTRQHTPHVDTSQVAGVLRLFRPLWHIATDEDLLHTDKMHARGNFRIWAKLTSHAHAHAARSRGLDTAAHRALLTWVCSRLGPNP